MRDGDTRHDASGELLRRLDHRSDALIREHRNDAMVREHCNDALVLEGR